MPISIFSPDGETDDGAVNDIVGRFRSGYQANGRPVGLDHFRVTTGDPDVAEALEEILGDREDGVTEWDTTTEEKLQLFTNADEVKIILDSPGAVRASLVMWGRKGMLYETDGTYLIEDGKVTDEEAPCAGDDIKTLKAKANAGTGPEPSLRVFFRLADAPELGRFKFFSSSWTAIDEFSSAEETVNDLGKATATLRLERVEFEKDGETRSFVKPRITNIKEVEA